MYEFNDVIIDENAFLSVDEWHPKRKKGGKLYIKSLNNIVIKTKGHIDVSGKGYAGGKPFECGISFKRSKKEKEVSSNCSGAGFGAIDAEFCYGNGGGASYGSNGENGGSNWYDGKRGNIYGDEKLSKLHLGSGGGGGFNHNGSNGGGVIYMYAQNKIILMDDSKIICDGGNNNGTGGAGSGGTIFLDCKQLMLNETSVIRAIGGYSINGGRGGNGRIRIKAVNNMNDLDQYQQICPKPYLQ